MDGNWVENNHLPLVGTLERVPFSFWFADMVYYDNCKMGKKSYLVVSILLAVFMLGVFFSLDTENAKASRPVPSEASCEGPKDTNRRFECDGERPGTSFEAIPIEPGKCVDVCNDAGGHALRYSSQTQKNGFDWYCFGATAPEKTCKVTGTDEEGKQEIQDLDVTTGVKTVSCGFADFPCVIKGLIGFLAGLLNVFIAPLATLMKAIVLALAKGMNGLINYVVSVPVSPSSVTAPGFVKATWDISRSLANNFFVLLLAIIGLTTILRISSYQWQKTLPSLFVAVLLINFSGVLVGLVVDMANIVTSAFLKGALQGTDWSVNEFGGTEALALHVAQILFYFFVGFAYFATMLLFVVRTVVLWILAAIGPLAFAFAVLPATRAYWEQWFKALIQWAIMGIPISFALYIASKAMSLANKDLETWGTAPTFFAQAVGPFTAVIILLMGISMALAGAPAISQNVMALGKKGITTLGKKAGAAAKTKIPAFARQKIVESGRLQGIAKRMATAPTPGMGKGILGRAAAPLWGTSRALGRTLGPGAIDAQKGVIGAAEKAVDKASVATVVSKFRGASDLEKIGYINRLIKQNDIDEAMSKHGLTFTEIQGARNKAEPYEEHKDMMSALPQLERARMGVVATRKGISIAQAYRDEIIGKIRPDRAKQVSESVLSKPEIVEAMVRSWDGRHIGNFIAQHGSKGVQVLENRIAALAAAAHATPGDWLKSPAGNPALYKYMTSQAGQSLGFTIT